MSEYLTTEELSVRIKFEPRYIREHLKSRAFQEGVHFVRPFGGRKLLFIWDAIEQLLLFPPFDRASVIPLRRKERR